MFKAVLIFFSITVLLAACSTSRPAFERMSYPELMAYNANKPLSQRVYCVDEVATGSRLRRTRCMPVHRWMSERADGFMELYVKGGGALN